MSQQATPPPKSPTSRWKFTGMIEGSPSYRKGRLIAISSCTNMKYPDSDEIGPQWHVSISENGERRVFDKALTRALADFGMSEAEEDNHHPGVARHFFLAVDPAHRIDCECKEEELTIVDADGYTWTTEADGCRGCEYQRMLGKPCPIHSIQEATVTDAAKQSKALLSELEGGAA